MTEQILLSLSDAKKIVTILKSKKDISTMWSEIYDIFHDGRGLKDHQERVVIAGTFDPLKYTLSYEDEAIEYFNLYDSSTNGSFGVDKSDFLVIMQEYIGQIK